MKKKSAKKKTLNPRIIYASIAILAFVLYGNTLQHGFVLDDGIFISNHASVQKGIGGIGEIFSQGSTYAFNNAGGQQPYRPLTLLTFSIGKTFYDNAPSMEHFLNIALYALIGIFLFQVLRLWLPKYHEYVLLAGVALFMVHPLHTEVVANIKSRDEILCLLFSLLSLWYVQKSLKAKDRKASYLSVLFFALAVLSKENGITMLAVIPLSLYFFSKTTLAQIGRRLLPYLGVAALYILVRSLVIETGTDVAPPDIINNILFGAANWGEQSATTMAILGKYLKLLLLPYPLSWDYSYNQIPLVGWANIGALAALVLHIVLLAFAALKLKQKNIFAFCILFYFITLSVVSNVFFLSGATLAERFLFMPSTAFAIALPILLLLALKLNPTSFVPKKNTIWLSIIGLLVLAGTILTINRNGDWKDNYSLFEAGAQASPMSSRAHASFAYEARLKAMATGNPQARQTLQQQSETAFLRSLEIYPNNHYALYNLGVLYYETGALDKAKNSYLKTLQVMPEHEEALVNLGVIAFQQKDFTSAKQYFEQVVAVNPSNGSALGNLGAIYHNQNDLQQAINYYDQSLALTPTNVEIYKNIIKIYTALGNTAKVQEYQQRMSQYAR